MRHRFGDSAHVPLNFQSMCFKQFVIVINHMVQEEVLDHD